MAIKVTKTLTRSKINRTVLGVCGGLGEYFNIDPTIIRLALILVTAFTGFAPGIVAYLLAALVMPEK